MSINNKIIIIASAVTILIIFCYGILMANGKTEYEGLAAEPISAYKININTASVEELTYCTGLGEKTAREIVDYREANGDFESVDELANIDGIGKKKIDQWKDTLWVE